MRRPQTVPNAILGAIALGFVQLLGCSSNCIPGATIFCSCPNGTQSNQTCKSDGSYAACACGGTSSGTASGGGVTSAGPTGGTASSAGSSSGGNATGGTSSGVAGSSSGKAVGGTSGTSGGGTTGASGGGETCSAPLDTPGTCTWPEFCVSGHCLPPQNMDGSGQDVPGLPCETSSATVQGAGNLDRDRANGGIDRPAAQSPILTDLQQIPIQQDDDCSAFIGSGAKEYQASAKACAGGTVDDGGATICASGEAALLFEGGIFDPGAALPATEGSDLDGHFYWMTSAAAPVRFTDSALGAAQSGFIIPSAGWGAAGGRFVMVQCLSSAQYPLFMNSDPVTLHFATGGIDAGLPGNSFCTQWSP